ncbi:Alpha/Beta hydrolase protein [Pterulicium gracile]|uniref:Carboxylic ester hydrolase n=1 Tax=Pterulicium gracile TaxID=1884261 RepID=A0A5C3QQG8_9AGAR|nr:Alpha/Beta hydrolase protein [Pterula gracilis]
MLFTTHLTLLAGALSTLPRGFASDPASTIANDLSAPVVDLGYASYRGSRSHGTNITSFLGIRFAAAPEGELRWKAPLPPLPVEGIQDATQPPRICYQAPHGTAPTSPWLREKEDDTKKPFSKTEDVIQGSEDCLFLNIYVPTIAEQGNSRLPVVVWIHGGGYLLGLAAPFDGSHLVMESSHKVIAVAIQYRLGLFGFLAGDEVKRGGQLNAGLLDQEFALRWVQEHIQKFGGDPNQVTIWGESAGGGSVLQHIIAHDGQTSPPLFRAGITSSLFLPPQYSYAHEIPQALYEQVVIYAGCGDAENTLGCLRVQDAPALAQINVVLTSDGLFGTWAFAPVVDGEFIMQPVKTALKQGKTNGAAVLSIVNSNEAFHLTDPNASFTAAEYARQSFPTLSESEAESVGAMYNLFNTSFDQRAQVQADSIFLCPTLLLQESFINSGKSAWSGQFAVSPGWHGLDICYYFGGFTFVMDPPPLFEADNFPHSFAKPFMNFAVSSDPNVRVDDTVHNPHWPQYKKSAQVPNEVYFGQVDEQFWAQYDEGPKGPVEMYFGQSEDGTRVDIRVAEVDASLLKRCR